jgi:hypothetical protein
MTEEEDRMKANFEDELKIRSDGRWLEACGPLDWGDTDEPTPANKVIVAVRVVDQNGIEAHGTSDVCGTSEMEWMVYLRPAPGQKFQVGPAEGIATLTVTEPLSTPNPKTLAWRQSVQLVSA